MKTNVIIVTINDPISEAKAPATAASKTDSFFTNPMIIPVNRMYGVMLVEVPLIRYVNMIIIIPNGTIFPRVT